MVEIEFTGERLVPGKVDYELEIEHIIRYNFAAQFVTGSIVLDAACGTGYGTQILSGRSRKVVGIDISEEAISYAKNFYGAENIEFEISSVEKLKYSEDTFDTVISFETLEHLNEESQDMFLKEIRRTLKPEGKLIISTPNHDVYGMRGENPFHIRELNLYEFKKFLEKFFYNVKILGQQFEVAAIISEQSDLQDCIIAGLDLEKAEYFIAVCSNASIENVKGFSVPREDGRYKELLNWARSLHEEDLKKNQWIQTLRQEAEKNDEQMGLLLKSERELRQEVKNKECHIEQLLGSERELQQEINNKEKWVGLLLESERELQQEIKNIDGQVGLLLESERELQQEIRNKEGHIDLLLESERELDRIKASRSWRYLARVWWLRDLLIPKASKRRIFIKLIAKLIKTPIRFMKKCTPSRIRKFFYYLKREGTSGVSRRIDECVLGVEKCKTHFVTSEVPRIKSIHEYERIAFDLFTNPKVSIIIPAYNQFNYTYECLKSIHSNTLGVAYEVIVADDCSTDLTTKILELFENIKVIRTQENLRFLKNCNNAAGYADGEYLLYLNNDTQVQHNWLKPLVELIESNESIGMVGSKLVYPDGKLQEAGGIIWSDASGWNFGRLSDPNRSEYNYVKEVDYISGAAIMIRKKLWNEIGGFDESFAPAYYEDCDLAFEVRRHGYKVEYQPLSAVVHFEGISNGTNINEGQKLFQEKNRDKFYEKWKDVLAAEHFKNGENVFSARDRSKNKKTVLVIDHYVPQFDRDAGSRCIFMYLKIFAEMGFRVIFLGDNFHRSEPYTETLQQLGVEVLYDPGYSRNWKSWLRDNGREIDFAYICRAHIATKYMDYVKLYTNARIIYFNIDMQHLRLYREYEISKDNNQLLIAKQMEKLEYDLSCKADILHVVGTYERDILLNQFPNKPVRNIPLYIFESVNESNRIVEGTSNIMFVGGFSHAPNEDGVLWFQEEIFPLIVKEIPNIRWYIIGSNPTDKIKAIASDNIIVTGYISDEVLLEYYKKCRLCVAPLRFGAGVKGKVIEAVYYGIPLITTPIGAEGLSLDEKAFAVANPDSSFAQEVISLYDDTDKLKALSNNCVDFIRNGFTAEHARAILEQDMGI